MESLLPSLKAFKVPCEPHKSDALAQAFMPYIYASVYRVLVSRRCGNIRHLAKAISLGIYTKLTMDDCKALNSFDGRKCSFETWLSLYAEKAALNHIRQSLYPTSQLSTIFAAMGVDVAGKEEAIDRQGDILEPTHKFVLRLLYDESLSFEEAANVLGVAPQVVRSLEGEAWGRIRMACRPAICELAQ